MRLEDIRYDELFFFVNWFDKYDKLKLRQQSRSRSSNLVNLDNGHNGRLVSQVRQRALSRRPAVARASRPARD